jgi:hypothetical protein
VNPAFDSMSFWGTVVCLLVILLVGCVAELVARIADRRRKDPPLHGPDSCMDAIADQDERGGALR